VIEHHFRQPGSVSYLRSRYSYLGHGLHGAIHTVTHDPGIFFKVLFTWPKLGYLQFLLAPVGYLALLAPLALALGAPTFALNLLSVDPHMYSGLGDNSAELISVVMIAAILGSGFLLATLQRRLPAEPVRLALGAYVLVAALWAQHAQGFTPIGSSWQLPTVGTHQEIADSFVRMVPPSVPVATQDQLDPHLSDRHDIYLFPDTGRANFGAPPLDPANDVLLDVSAPTYPLPSGQIHDFAQRWIHRPGWGIAAARDGLILIRRGATRRSPPAGFYNFAQADRASIPHRLNDRVSGFKVLGYDLARVDLANHRVPTVAYDIYLRPVRRLTRAYQPVVYEIIDGNVINVAFKPLGLDWLPTNRWRPGHTYVVRMDPIETETNRSGRARFYLEVRPAVPPARLNDPGLASRLWEQHGRLVHIGSLQVTSLG
jgi:hypothetical protein